MPVMGAVAPVQAQVERPTKQITLRAVDPTQAVALVKAGQLDIFLFEVPREIASANLGSPDVSFMLAPAGINDFILNPAVPEDPNKLNPFVSKRIRYAVNYLVDRTFIVQQIFKGFAFEMYTFEAPPDPDFAVIADLVAKYKTTYNPDLAAQIINEEMVKLGAVKGEDGKWYYNGNPVTINFVIRIEDERHDQGLLLADELEKLGFTVNRLEMTFGEAIDLVYFTDPDTLDWMIYTEGWGKGGIARWADFDPAFWGSPWFGLMPGWQDPTFWNYENETLDNITKTLAFGLFSNMDERNELFRKATEMIIQEAIRIFTVTTLDPQPYHPDMRGITEDRGAGLRSLYNLREVYVPGKPNLEAGHLHVYTARTLWGPVDARNWHFFDVYSVDPWTAIHDPWIWVHPHSGQIIPFRVGYNVTTAGPDGVLEVPADAFVWDPEAKAWTYVGEGVAVKSKVTFDLSNLLGTNWHHGRPISWADVLYDIYLFYEWTFASDKMDIDPIWNSYFSDTLPFLKGFRIVGDTQLEVYVDYWHFDENEIAGFAVPPVTFFPWEVNYAVEQLVIDGAYAWNRFMSSALGVPQINYVLSGHALDVAAKMNDLLAAGDFPANVFVLPDGTVVFEWEDAEARYNAALEWINDKELLVISNGPFYLQSFDPAGDSLVMRAFEDATYPFPPGTWVFGTFLRPSIERTFAPSVNVGAEGTVIIDITQLVVPYTVQVNYFVIDPATGDLLAKGTAEQVGDFRYAITFSAEFTSELGPGTYQLDLLLYSPEFALLDYRTEFFSILGGGALAEEIEALERSLEALSGQLGIISESLSKAIGDLSTALTDAIGGVSDAIDAVGSDVAGLSGDISALSDDISALEDRVSRLEGALSQINTMLLVAVVLVLINLIITGVGLVKKS
jgi:peptide/nickel transport system substrate-binding protein